jgi:7-carboxy-7-deazaguanine synthase
MTAPPSTAHRVALLQDSPPGQLLIHELYRSVQGESTFAGLPCVFVRLAVCNSRCVWCFVPETPILMADWNWKPLGDLAVGDEVLGLSKRTVAGTHRRLAVGQVTHVARRVAETVVVNRTLRCTPDHNFWLTGKNGAGDSAVHNGWREVERCLGYRVHFLAGATALDRSLYERGWLSGMADGDGCFWTLKHRRGYRRFRLALKEQNLLQQAAAFAARAGFSLRAGVHVHVGHTGPGTLDCLWLTRDAVCQTFEAWLAEDIPHDAWRWGYLGGMLDAEGSLSVRLLRVAQNHQAHPDISQRIRRVLDALDVCYTAEEQGFYIHRSGGDLWRILCNARPAKPSITRAALTTHPRNSRIIDTVEPTGRAEEVVTLSTTVGSFIAGGYVVMNCDTPHAFTQGRWLSVEDVLAKALAFDCPLVEITGGEPLLQADVLPLMARLADAGRTVLLETSGALDVGPVDPRVHVIMDLKCPDSGECENNCWPNLDRLKPTDQIKFVIASRRDFDWAVDVVRRHGLDRRITVLLSPAYGLVQPIELATWLLASGLQVRMQLQMHKSIWDPKARGV